MWITNFYLAVKVKFQIETSLAADCNSAKNIMIKCFAAPAFWWESLGPTVISQPKIP